MGLVNLAFLLQMNFEGVATFTSISVVDRARSLQGDDMLGSGC